MRTILVCSAIAATTLPLSVSRADTITVQLDGSGDFVTIQAAITAAASGDTIEVGAGIFAERLTVSDKTLEIRSTAVKGAETIVDATDSGRLLYVSGNAVTLTLRGLSLINGTASTGGGVYASQADLELHDCHFEDHDATGVGAGIYLANGSDLSASNCTFANCRSEDRGGAIYAEANSQLLLTTCTFQGNRARSEGGAIAVATGVHTFDSCSFTGNALTYDSNGSSFGGAIRARGSTLTVDDCTFDSNTHDLTPYESTRYGGALSLLNGTIAVINGGSFVSNSAGYGGGIHATDASGVSIDGTTFTANEARFAGGAICCENAGSITSAAGVFSGNTARYYGGAVHASGGSHAFTNSTFLKNSLTATNGSDTYGAGLHATGNVTMAGCTFTSNTAPLDINPVAHYGGGAYLAVDADSTVTSCTFTGNTSGTGGGLWMSEGLVLGSTFNGNLAGIRGGGAHANGTVAFELCQFTANTCDIRWDDSLLGGGAVFMFGGTLVDCIFRENAFTNDHDDRAYGGGGAVFAYGMALDLDDCTFVANTARWYQGTPSHVGGGAIFAYSSTITASGATSFTGNEAIWEGPTAAYHSGGGAIKLCSSTVTLNNVPFEGNSARFTQAYASSSSGGGAIQSYDGGLSMFTNCTFHSNAVTSTVPSDQSAGGGAIMTHDGVDLTNCNLTANRAVRLPSEPDSGFSGGAVWVYPRYTSNFLNTIFTDNEADRYGGAIYTEYSSNAFITGSTLTGNAAGNTGGGVYGNSTAYLSDSTHCDNAPNNYAGSISDGGGNVFQGHCDGSDTIIAVPDEYATIAEGVRHALSGDVIEIAPGTYSGTIDLTNRDISITGLEGAQKTIIDLEGGNLRGIYAPETSSSGTIRGLTIRNASARDLPGVGIYVRGPMTIEDCVFENLELRNDRQYSGGAGLFIETESDQTATVRNCAFTDCLVRNPYTSADFGGGGGIYHRSGDLDITSCTFTNCVWRQEASSPEYSGGGGLYHLQGNLSINGTTFNGCQTQFQSGNSSDYFMQGGAIRFQGGTIDELHECMFANCESAAQGGALYVYTHDDALQLSSCQFTECRADLEGGGIFIGNGLPIIADELDFEDCTSQNAAGAIYLTGDQSSLSNCTFDRCTSESDGGAIHGSASNCTLEACSFADCDAVSRGGATYLSGNNHLFTSCSFLRCNGTYGGGAYLGTNSSVQDCSFIENIASSKASPARGGGLYLGDGSNIADCEFLDNLCESTGLYGGDDLGGGAIYCHQYCSIERSSFSRNAARFTGHPANTGEFSERIGGGGVSCYGYLTIEDSCSFEDNSVVMQDVPVYRSGGGAILYRGDDGGHFDIAQTVFAGNIVRLEGDRPYASIGGGAIHRYDGGSTSLDIQNCTLNGNGFFAPPTASTSSGGGAVWMNGQQPSFTTCTFTDNFTESSDTTIDRFFHGGAIYASAPQTKVIDCQFLGNHCGGDGGGVYLGSNNDIEITSSTFIGNGAYQGPAGAVRMPNESTDSITACSACSNAPSNFGNAAVDERINTIAVRCDGDSTEIEVPAEYESITKAVRFAFDGDTILIGPGTWKEAIEFLGRDLSLIGTEGPDVTVIDATGWGRPAVVTDRADGIGTIAGLTLTGAETSGGLGGGARLAGSMTVSNCVIENNKIMIPPGGIGAGAGVAFTTAGATVSLENVVVRGNEITFEAESLGFGRGGGIHATVESLELSSCTIDDNLIDGPGRGGGLAAESSVVTINGSSLTTNRVLDGDGGNVHLDLCSTQASTSIFRNGLAGIDGGGVHATGGTLIAVGCEFSDNTAAGTGGGIATTSAGISLVDCTVERNSAEDAAGGRFESGPVWISNCTIAENSAVLTAGGLDLPYSQVPTIEDTEISRNTAGHNAGGIRMAHIEGENGARLVRCAVLDNVAGGAGGGIRVETIDTKVTIVDGIVGENVAEVGGGINSFDTRQLTLQNVAVYNNHATLFGGGLYDEGYGGGLQETVINESTVSGNTAGAVGGGIYLLLREMAISNTAFCGNDPGQIIGFWTDYGGNSFGDGTCFFDCNGNGLEDGVEIAEGQLQDCDENGVPDLCEIADGSAEDCDGDGVPDVCAKGGFVTATSGTLGPFGLGVPQSLSLVGTPPAGGPVTITVETIGDLSGPSEYGVVTVNGVEVGTLFEFGEDCGDESIVGSLDVDAAIFNMLTATGPAEIVVTGSIAVDAEFCDNGSTRITIDYLQASDGDCNDNGLLDHCEIAGGLADDCNGNGVPDDCELDGGMAADCNENGLIDGCEIASGDVGDKNENGIPDACECPFDLTGDGMVDGSDIGAFLGFWGTSDPTADFDGDGAVQASDLGLLLGAFGACG